MIKIIEKGAMSIGTIDDYLSGREEYNLDRRSTRGSPGIVGGIVLIIGEESRTLTAHKLGIDKYIFFYDDYKGRGSSPKAAFFDLLKVLKSAGLR
jgi:hypothetical protein